MMVGCETLSYHLRQDNFCAPEGILGSVHWIFVCCQQQLLVYGRLKGFGGNSNKGLIKVLMDEFCCYMPRKVSLG